MRLDRMRLVMAISLAAFLAVVSCTAVNVHSQDNDAKAELKAKWIAVKKVAIPVEPEEEKTTALPSASEVIDQHVMSMGGYELLGSLQSSHFVFKGKSSNGSKLESTYYQTRGQYYCYLERNGLKITRGVWANGELDEKGHRVGFAWESVNDQSWREKSGDELQEYLRRRTRVVASPFWKEDFRSIECVSKASIRGIQAWKIRFVDQDGKEIFRYFDVETGYLLRRRTMESFGGRLHDVTREYMDHQKKGDFVVAMRQSISYDGIVEQWRVEHFEYDCEVPEELLDVPLPIQRQIDQAEQK